MKAIAKNEGIGGSIRHLLKRRNPELYQEAKDYYRQAIELIRQDGFEVSTFNYPYVLDDRIDRDPSIQEMFHIVRVASDFDVYILYRTFFQDSGPGTGVANVISYGQSMHGQSAGIGSYFDSDLTWDQLEEDDRVAARFSPILQIYTLEGLIDHRWLESHSTIDLNHTRPPAGGGKTVDHWLPNLLQSAGPVHWQEPDPVHRTLRTRMGEHLYRAIAWNFQTTARHSPHQDNNEVLIVR